MDMVSTLAAVRCCFNSSSSVAHAAVPVKIARVPLSIGSNISTGVVETAEEDDDEEKYDRDGWFENQIVVADTNKKWRTSINEHSGGGKRGGGEVNDACSDYVNSSVFNGRRVFMYSMLTSTIPILLSHGAHASIPPTSPLTERQPSQQIDTFQTLTIRTEIRKVLTKLKSAGILRLVFHDAGTFDLKEKKGGMNGSIIYELERPENVGLSKSVKVLEKVKDEVDKLFPVSWADLIAVAGSEAVFICGGPFIPVQIGRDDARSTDPSGKLPLESFDASALKKCFMEKGFSTQELVVLSGAHTLGTKGFGNPFVFDNSYFKILLEKPSASPSEMLSMIGLPSDRALSMDENCLRWIKIYADDQMRFFDDFTNAYTKLVNSGTLWKKTE
ncbi:putative L-ascorbate peroxidase 6 [Zostera marina]|uniref:L-ascorbate peroxidase n=1 Tax=Zostera marina TaxID=29655 RepID=A0A0K9NYT2_ZOSMR|nr:putative L-ascorbate peroxidase 6 [Zostera marina]